MKAPRGAQFLARELVKGIQIFPLNQRLRIQRTLLDRQAGQVRSASE